ncbi:MAG: hypothetical protein ACRD2G_02050, partial [Terriglobia bacterium]
MKMVQAVLHEQALEGLSGMLSKLPLFALLSLIDRLGYLLGAALTHESVDPGKKSKRKKQWEFTVKGSLTDRVEAYVAVSQALTDWPGGFHRALDAMNPRIIGRTEGSENYRQAEDLFYQSLLKGNAASRYLVFLRAEYARHWNCSDANEVAQPLQLSPSVDDYGNMLQSPTDESRAEAPVGPIIADRDIPRAVGLPLSVLQALRAQGIYKASGGRGASYNWYRNDIDKFLERLRTVTECGATCARGYHRTTVTVKQAMSLNLRSAHAKADIIAALLDGRLRAIATARTPLGAVRIDKGVLDEFLLEKRVAVEGGTYSYPEAARICRIDLSAVKDAVSQGLLQGVQRLERTRISAQSV